MSGPGLTALRIALAAVFVAHGAHKLFGTFAGPAVGPGGLDNTAARLETVGLPGSLAVVVLAGVTQLLGGALIGVGWLTRWAASALLGYVVIGMWKEHAAWGFFLNWTGQSGRGQGLEYSIVLAGALICLILMGGGKWSLDGRRANRAASRAAGRARLRRG